MGAYLNPGNKMFQRTLNGRFYVDKTGLAAFLNERMGTDEGFVAVSRPRRFGKSVDADMLVAYYGKGCDSSPLFEGLTISSDSSYRNHLNAHDVIKLDVSQVLPYAESLIDVGAAIERELLEDLQEQWPNQVDSSGGRLFKALGRIADSKSSGFVFVIDEWDCVIREAGDDERAKKAYLDFLRDLLKGRAYVDACYMTGILPIRKYGKHSALNLFREYSMTKPKRLAQYVGFSASEVERLSRRFGMEYSELSRWYDGYLIGPDRVHVYNPNSVANAIGEGQCLAYWTDTETYEALSVYIDMDFDGVQQDLVAMLDGQHVPASVDFFENDMTKVRSKNDVYALLVHLGYLGYDEVERTVFIPNEEIRREFTVAVEAGARPQLAQLVRDSRELQRLALAGDEEYVADALRRAHASAAGPRYYNDEQALRAAVELAFIWSIDEYLRVDELPGGRGYADVVYLPKPNSVLPPIVVELKWNKPADAAIGQIKRRDYPAALSGLVGECVLIGVTYEEDTTEHTCQIQRVTL